MKRHVLVLVTDDILKCADCEYETTAGTRLEIRLEQIEHRIDILIEAAMNRRPS